MKMHYPRDAACAFPIIVEMHYSRDAACAFPIIEMHYSRDAACAFPIIVARSPTINKKKCIDRVPRSAGQK